MVCPPSCGAGVGESICILESCGVGCKLPVGTGKLEGATIGVDCFPGRTGRSSEAFLFDSLENGGGNELVGIQVRIRSGSRGFAAQIQGVIVVEEIAADVFG